MKKSNYKNSVIMAVSFLIVAVLSLVLFKNNAMGVIFSVGVVMELLFALYFKKHENSEH